MFKLRPLFCNSMEKFRVDIEYLILTLGAGTDSRTRETLARVGKKLTELREKGLAMINHSAAELVCVKHFTRGDYDVDVEVPLAEDLVCDIYAKKKDETCILEVETGFVPPENALDPILYRETRIASKIARYGKYAKRFGLGTPSYHKLQIPEVLLSPPGERDGQALVDLKHLCSRYYTNPPITLAELRSAHLDFICMINVDEQKVTEIEPRDYVG